MSKFCICPTICCDICIPATAISGRQHLRSAATGTLLVPRARTAAGQQSFAVNGPVTWNHLPLALVDDPTIRQPGFDLPRQQWCLLNRFRTEQGHCSAWRRKWRLTDNDLSPCGETQTMSHIVESCLLTKLNGGLSQLHSADEDAVSWLTSYGS